MNYSMAGQEKIDCTFKAEHMYTLIINSQSEQVPVLE
jgi:hypothetical protein